MKSTIWGKERICRGGTNEACAVLTSQCHTVAARARLTATGFHVKLSASNKHAVPMPAFENSVAVSVQYVNALSICMIALVWRVINVLPLLLLAAALVCMYVWKPAQAAAAALFKPAHKQHTSLLHRSAQCSTSWNATAHALPQQYDVGSEAAHATSNDHLICDNRITALA
eukprot:20079-Heterococcus_DN1.PRE.2